MARKVDGNVVTYENDAYLHRVIDGDTFEFWVDPGFEQRFLITARIKDFDAPEIFNSCKSEVEYMHGLFAALAAYRLLANKRVVLVSYKSKYKTGAYNRYLVIVHFPGVSSDITFTSVMTLVGCRKCHTYTHMNTPSQWKRPTATQTKLTLASLFAIEDCKQNKLPEPNTAIPISHNVGITSYLSHLWNPTYNDVLDVVGTCRPVFNQISGNVHECPSRQYWFNIPVIPKDIKPMCEIAMPTSETIDE